MKFAKLLSNFTSIAVSFFFVVHSLSFHKAVPEFRFFCYAYESLDQWIGWFFQWGVTFFYSLFIDSSSRKVLYLYYSPRLILEQQQRHHKRKIAILEIQTVISLKRFTLDAEHIHLYPPINSQKTFKRCSCEVKKQTTNIFDLHESSSSGNQMQTNWSVFFYLKIKTLKTTAKFTCKICNLPVSLLHCKACEWLAVLCCERFWKMM